MRYCPTLAITIKPSGQSLNLLDMPFHLSWSDRQRSWSRSCRRCRRSVETPSLREIHCRRKWSCWGRRRKGGKHGRITWLNSATSLIPRSTREPCKWLMQGVFSMNLFVVLPAENPFWFPWLVWVKLNCFRLKSFVIFRKFYSPNISNCSKWKKKKCTEEINK